MWQLYAVALSGCLRQNWGGGHFSHYVFIPDAAQVCQGQPPPSTSPPTTIWSPSGCCFAQPWLLWRCSAVSVEHFAVAGLIRPGLGWLLHVITVSSTAVIPERPGSHEGQAYCPEFNQLHIIPSAPPFSRQTPHIRPSLGWCWASVADAGPTSTQRRLNVLCLQGLYLPGIPGDRQPVAASTLYRRLRCCTSFEPVYIVPKKWRHSF